MKDYLINYQLSDELTNWPAVYDCVCLIRLAYWPTVSLSDWITDCPYMTDSLTRLSSLLPPPSTTVSGTITMFSQRIMFHSLETPVFPSSVCICQWLSSVRHNAKGPGHTLGLWTITWRGSNSNNPHLSLPQRCPCVLRLSAILERSHVCDVNGGLLHDWISRYRLSLLMARFWFSRFNRLLSCGSYDYMYINLS